MESNELRIGNWVQLKNRYVKIISIAHEDNEDYVKCLGEDLEFLKSLNPIPLTHELLVKCGFHKMNQAWVEADYDVKNYNHWYFTIWDAFGGEDLKYNSAEFNVPLKSLHQLQNLYFALTGTELNVSLV